MRLHVSNSQSDNSVKNAGVFSYFVIFMLEIYIFKIYNVFSIDHVLLCCFLEYMCNLYKINIFLYFFHLSAFQAPCLNNIFCLIFFVFLYVRIEKK